MRQDASLRAVRSIVHLEGATGSSMKQQLLIFLSIFLPVSLLRGAEPVVEFRQHMAPILARYCLECHAGADPKGQLDLSQRSRVLQGGDSGPALVAGDAESSLLWQRIRDGEMPPKESLPDVDRERIKRWIQQGAEWKGGDIDPFQYSTDRRAGYDWWSLQPLKRSEPPTVPMDWTSRVSNPIDAFVLSKLHDQKLTPSDRADPRLLVRRLAIDLTGLPPSPDDVDAFTRSPSPQAYEDLVAQYLDSPAYGERWARHWLDLARYGESQGFERDRLRSNAWPYRDWVIEAFNRDMPYDQFVQRQIAGDLLQPDSVEGIIATGFLVAAPYDEVGQSQQSAAMRAVVRQDELEDLVGTVSQTFLGLTVNCSRCHDHKFDPITQVEYYQLAACLDGVRHGDRSITTPVIQQELASVESQLKSASLQFNELEASARTRVLQDRQPGDRPSSPQPLARWSFDNDLQDQIGELHGQVHPGAERRDGSLLLDGKTGFMATAPITVPLKAKTLEAWVQLSSLEQAGGGVIGVQTPDGAKFDTIVFGEQESRHWMAGSEGLARTQSFGGAEETEADKRLVHVAIVYADDGTITAYRDGLPYGRSYVAGEVTVFEAGQAQVVIGLRHGTEAGGNRALAGSIDAAQLYDRALTAEEVAASFKQLDLVTTAELVAALSADQRNMREKLQTEIHMLTERRRDLTNYSVYACAPRPPGKTHLLLRGNPGTPREVVSPRGLSAISTLTSEFGLTPDAPDEARRVALANWISSQENPLLARVMVNRVWQHHFGVGLVDSPNDFGFNGGRPTHPELLDYLADWFVQHDWSLKKLHTLILTSNTWKQSSRRLEENAASDADNRWLWRYAPYRLEAETIRDAMLSVSGQLNSRYGGPPYQDFRTFTFNSQFFEMFDPETPDAHRRTIYRTWIRSGRSSLLDALDCPDPSTTAPRRAITTTPVQSLSLLNNSFVLRMSEATAHRLNSEFPDDTPAQIDRLLKRAYGRGASKQESQELASFVHQYGMTALCRVIFNSNEFVYLE